MEDYLKDSVGEELKNNSEICHFVWRLFMSNIYII